MDDCLIDMLMDVVANGRKSVNGFKKETYKAVVESVRSTLEISVVEKHVGNRLRTLKRLYFEVRDTLSASGFRWDDDKKLVTAPDDVCDNYIRSHPYAQHVHGKPVRMYDDLMFLFGSDQATGLRASTGNMHTQRGTRNSHDDNVTLTASVDLNDDILILSSDDMGDSGQNIQWSFQSHDGAHIANRSPIHNGNNSVNTGNITSSRKRARLEHPCDVIGKGMSEVADTVKSLALTLHKGKDVIRMEQIVPALEQIDGLTSNEVISATRIMSKDEQQSASFLSLPESMRLDFVLMILAPDQSSD
ncbi:uncharacterized protein LOC131233732 [Magnolia sinica]|uniref:uncharacterized protein LOC131233732 n=1 Tax=Magnolia sinica TaxID=86752 RepID=UPI002658A0B0|nr:uncharacterized protein LOC131233732 [Magnolia sinica]